MVETFEFPLIDKTSELTESYKDELLKIAELPRNKSRVKPEVLGDVIIQLCSEQYITLNALAELVNRNSDGLRQRYIKFLVEDGKLKRAFPATPNHEQQAYIANQ